MADVVIFGTGDIAQLAHYYFTRDSKHRVSAFTVDKEFLEKEKYCGLPVIPFEELEREAPPQKYMMFIGVGYAEVNKVRARKYFGAKKKGYKFASYVSSKATLFDNVQLGDNCFVLEDNTIQPFADIGNNVTLWSGNHIGHHSRVGDHCFISSHVVISGGVNVEPYCFIGVNATVRDHIRIARECIIGAGSVILKDTVEKGVYKGSSTRLSRIPSDRFRCI